MSMGVCGQTGFKGPERGALLCTENSPMKDALFPTNNKFQFVTGNEDHTVLILNNSQYSFRPDVNMTVGEKEKGHRIWIQTNLSRLAQLSISLESGHLPESVNMGVFIFKTGSLDHLPRVVVKTG